MLKWIKLPASEQVVFQMCIKDYFWGMQNLFCYGNNGCQVSLFKNPKAKALGARQNQQQRNFFSPILSFPPKCSPFCSTSPFVSYFSYVLLYDKLPTTQCLQITVIYSFSQFYGSGLQRELSGQFFLPLTLVGGQSFSLVQYDWAGLEMPRRFYSVIRRPSASHVTSPRSSFVLSHSVVVCGQSGLSHGSWFPRGKKKKPPILLSLGLGSPRSRHTTSSALQVTRLPQNSKGGETDPTCSKGRSGHVHMGKEKNDGGHLRDHSFTIGSWRRLRCEALTLPRRTHQYGYVPKVSSVEA